MIDFSFLQQGKAKIFLSEIIQNEHSKIFLYHLNESDHAMIGIPDDYNHRNHFFWNFLRFTDQGLFSVELKDTPIWFQEIVSKAEDLNKRRFRLIELYE